MCPRERVRSSEGLVSEFVPVLPLPLVSNGDSNFFTEVSSSGMFARKLALELTDRRGVMGSMNKRQTEHGGLGSGTNIQGS